MLDKVTSKNFKDIEGTKAVLTIMDGPDVELTVREVHEIKVGKDEERPADCRKNPFTVVLSGPEGYQAPDGCYDINFEKIGLLAGVFIDNRSDNPETGDFNTGQAQKAAAEVKKKAKALAQKKASPKAKVTAAEDTPPLAPPEPVVLYEITFG